VTRKRQPPSRPEPPAPRGAPPRRRGGLALVAVACLAATIAGSWWWLRTPSFALDVDPERNILLVTVDTLRADGFVRVRHWLRADDDLRRAFLTDAGWAADGAHREIGSEDDTVRVKQIRLHTAID